MQEDINLEKMLRILWKGKHLIVGVVAAAVLISGLVSFFIVDHTYYYKAFTRIDLSLYELSSKELKDQFAGTEKLEEALVDLPEIDPAQAVTAMEMEVTGDDSEYLELYYLHPDPETAREVTEQTGAYLLEAAKERRISDLKRKEAELQAKFNTTEEKLESIWEEQKARLEQDDRDVSSFEDYGYVSISIKTMGEEINLEA